MSEHYKAIVPLGSWCYNSPELRTNGHSIDIGLLAESLIYYDCVLINVTTQPQFAELLNWFVQQNKYSDFLALIKNGVIKIYDYAFISTAVNQEGVYSLVNIQDPIQAQPNTFEQRFLYHQTVQSCLGNSRQKKSLYKTLRNNVIEVKADSFGSAIFNAKYDGDNPERNALIIQKFIDELYSFRNIGDPPKVESTVKFSEDNKRRQITWNVKFNQLTALAGKELNFHLGTPLVAGAISNRLLFSASQEKCDLYLGTPMSHLVGDKLFESNNAISKTHNVIEQLTNEVEFPDIRSLVNAGQLKLSDILKIRKKAKTFRTWLQDESERDRNAIIAYHHEVAKELGIISAGRKTLNLFGVLGSGALGAFIGTTMAGPPGAAIGGAAGTATGYLFDIASKIGEDWKPVVFGNWVKNRIAEITKEKK